jgi:hypothetical protein
MESPKRMIWGLDPNSPPAGASSTGELEQEGTGPSDESA